MIGATELIAAAAALYVVESALLVRRGDVLLEARRRGWKARRCDALPGGDDWAVALPGLLPPLRPAAVCRPLPLALAPQGAITAGGRLVPWERLAGAHADGGRVSADGLVLARLSSDRAAGELVAALRRVAAAAPGAAREAAIGAELDAHLDASAARAALARWREAGPFLGVVTNALFGYVFLAVPVVVARRGLVATWPVLLAGLLALLAAAGVEWWFADRALRGGSAGSRLGRLIPHVLAPLGMIRARQAVARDLFGSLHPLAAACAVLPPAARAGEAARWLREARHPAVRAAASSVEVHAHAADPDAAELDAAAAGAWYHAALSARLEAMVARETGASPDELLVPPAPDSDESCAYCPRCLAQYTAAGSVCSDCGLELVAIRGSAGGAPAGCADGARTAHADGARTGRRRGERTAHSNGARTRTR